GREFGVWVYFRPSVRPSVDSLPPLPPSKCTIGQAKSPSAGSRAPSLCAANGAKCASLASASEVQLARKGRWALFPRSWLPSTESQQWGLWLLSCRGPSFWGQVIQTPINDSLPVSNCSVALLFRQLGPFPALLPGGRTDWKTPKNSPLDLCSLRVLQCPFPLAGGQPGRELGHTDPSENFDQQEKPGGRKERKRSERERDVDANPAREEIPGGGGVPAFPACYSQSREAGKTSAEAGSATGRAVSPQAARAKIVLKEGRKKEVGLELIQDGCPHALPSERS
ncbi:uncharacterized protein LOC121918253, partial [Sceloporus undulatus]|uniref:uncharacterized protein LOC121918253 n=1 Tax=Sceloporus undulatus TaxID=8520 RepID=UPI001C4A9ED1